MDRLADPVECDAMGGGERLDGRDSRNDLDNEAVAAARSIVDDKTICSLGRHSDEQQAHGAGTARQQRA